MAYRITLRSKAGELRRSMTVVTLDRYETGRALRNLSTEETLHVGDYVIVEEIPRDQAIADKTVPPKRIKA